ncbi:MAG: DEAD/DEAH box helicase family protein [Candidatus Lokiarchaeota archaeon]|nr:DEAD/DEAH box helicase family protein [Candidatus Lokiarchaeota archaeon]
MSETRGDLSKNGQVLNYQGLEIRKYQLDIAEACKDKNSLVVLPTGLGKTIIAVLVTSKILDIVPSNSKIIILAPTRPLINQHYETFLQFLNISEEKFAVLTGKILPEKRIKVFNKNQILFYTPQTLRNDLVNKKYTLEDTALIIFDEAHHASGDYPYTMISDEFVVTNPDGIILGLTASPGASKKKIATLCEILHISIKNIHIRTRKDEDVKTYLKPMDIYKIGVDLTSLMEDIYATVTHILEERLHYLSQLNFLEAKGENLYTKIIRKDLLRLNSELVGLLQNSGDKTGVYSALSINAQALILYHMLELIEQQGLDILLNYFNKLYKDSKKKNSSKANRILAADQRLHNIFLELKKNEEFSPENLIHPKYLVLEKILVEELKNNPLSRILVFIKLRNSVKSIVNKLESTDLIKPVRFVGQATKSPDDKGLSQKQQIEILDMFRGGQYNVLVSTNVGEEGLDIAECDLVIFYDVVASEIRYIQRKGRTARHREGKVIILYSKKTRDEIYMRIALDKLKRMNFNLKESHQLKDSYKRPQITIEHNLDEGFNKEVPHELELASKKRLPKIASKSQHQSKLTSYLNTPVIQDFPIKLSKYLPMKFGLRKKLQKDNYSFGIVDSDLHIVIYNKVLIQIYDPQNIEVNQVLKQIEDFTQTFSLLIIIFDFIDFREGIEGEKRLHKKRLQDLGNTHNFQVITIDNEAELYFIVNSILETSK